MVKRVSRTLPPDDISVPKDVNGFSAFCEVFVPLSPKAFTYGISSGVPIFRGSVVWVQLARRKPVLGVVSRLVSRRPAFLKAKTAIPHASGYVFGERFMEKLEWVSSYYMATPMQSLNVFLPRDFGAYLDAAIASSVECPEVVARQKMSCELPPLTGEQKTALFRLSELLLKRSGFRGALLHGVTGSGKTRVYMELAALALSAGKKVLVLVPEIGLAPQTATRFSGFLGFDVPVIHSALSAPKKRAAWVSILSGKAKIVVGTRSAVLSPFDYDLVILDEEHDASYKQKDSAPRYHARNIALHEAYKFGALVVLGSATPSLETFLAAKKGNLEYLVLLKRATETELPSVRIVDMKKKARLQDSSLLLSSELREALSETVARGDQAIILMNRRGYSKVRLCTECGEPLSCPECRVPLVYHKQYGGLLCHYCGKLLPLGTKCPSCGSSEFEFAGGAIEKLEEEIAEWVPMAKTVRMDRDTTANVGAAERILSDFRERKFSVLLGTQIVAKGHDFPNVQLVGVVGADSGAGGPDFRSGEKLFELLSQTSGRAGRARVGGKVILQTNNPDDPIVRFAVAHDYLGFAKEELKARFEAHYPPYSKVATIELGHKSLEFLENRSRILADELSKNASLEILGPVEAYISPVRDTYWMHILVKANLSSDIRRALSDLPTDLEIRVDIDPM